MKPFSHRPLFANAALLLIPALISLAAVFWPLGHAFGDAIDTTVKLTPRQSTVSTLDFEPARMDREERFMQSLSSTWAGPDLFIRAILLDESWEEWISYQRSLQPHIPLQSLKLIVRSNRRVPGMIGYGRGPSSRPESESRLAAGKSIKDLETTFFIYTRKGRGDYPGFLSFDATASFLEKKHWSWVSFLLEEDGILSGEEWSLDNFLPRLATVAVLLALGFVLTETFRYIIRLGKRQFKRR